MARTEILRSLRNRLELTAALGRAAGDPGPAVEAPVFVIGMARSGTSILHELLACDPAHRAPVTWELLHPADGPGDAEPWGDAEHPFWHDVQPEYEAMHHNAGDLPNECIFATMNEFLSDHWGGVHEVPSYSMHLAVVGPHRRLPLPPADPADPPGRAAGRAVAAQGPQPPGHPRRPVRRLPRRPHRPRPPGPAEDRAVDPEPDGHPEVDALPPHRPVATAAAAGLGLRGHARRRHRGSGLRPPARRPVRRHPLRRPAGRPGDGRGRASTTSSAGSFPAVDPARPSLDHLAARPQAKHGTHAYALEDFGLDPAEERARFTPYQERFQVPDEA